MKIILITQACILGLTGGPCLLEKFRCAFIQNDETGNFETNSGFTLYYLT